MQNQAAINAANQATGLASGISGLQTGLVNNQNAAYQGASRIPSQSFDAEQALGAAAGGYNLGNQLVYEPRKGGYAKVSESVPQRRNYFQTMPNYNVAPVANPFGVPDYRTANFKSFGP
jgi:hypothetical protein